MHQFRYMSAYLAKALFLLAYAAFCMPIQTLAQELLLGDMAPKFHLTGSDGTIHKLSDYRGTTVVLAWFPKAFTGG